MRQWSYRLLGIGTLLAMNAPVAASQSPKASRAKAVLGVSGAGMVGPHDLDHLLGLGLAIGIEKRLSDAITVRAVATAMRGAVGARDDQAICIPAPNDGCLPGALMPRWLSTIELTVSAMIVPVLPLRVVAGFGITVAADAREVFAGAPKAKSATETPSSFSGGIEVPLGSSPRAPRLQLTRVWFNPRPFSMRRLDALTILW